MKHPVARYLMCSYSYYELDDPLISDVEFDQLAVWLLKHYDNITHQHKHLITKDDLTAGTYLGKYPEMVKGAVQSWTTEYTKPQQMTIMKNMVKEQEKYIRMTMKDFSL